MPTRYWLVDPELTLPDLAARGGRRRARRRRPPSTPTRSRAAHDAYAAERDAAIARRPRRPPPARAGWAAPAPASSASTPTTPYLLAGGDDPVGRVDRRRPARARRRERRVTRRRRRVDIGTNSVRLLVADVDGTTPRDAKVVAPRPAHAHHPARPGCRPHACARTRGDRAHRPTCCASTAPRSTSTASTDVRATATSAARDATQPRRVLRRRARRARRRRPSCSPVRRRPRSSFLGATADLDAPAPYLVVDIGGGSTEFVLGTDAPTGLVSLDIGCVRITEQFLDVRSARARGAVERGRGRARPRRRRAARRSPVRPRPRRSSASPAPSPRSPRSSSGCPSTTPSGSTTSGSTRAAAEDVFRTLATESAAQRAHNPGLEPGRVDVIVGGAIVLVDVFRVLGFDEVLVSEADILDGLVRSQVGEAEPCRPRARKHAVHRGWNRGNPPTRRHVCAENARSWI